MERKEIERSTMVSFDEIKEIAGFGWAVKICKEKLPPEFWDQLIFDDLQEIHRGDDRTAVALGERIAETFEQWLKIADWEKHFLATHEVPSNTTATNLMKLADSFDRWIEVYHAINSGSFRMELHEKQREVITKLMELTTTSEQWEKLFFGICERGKYRRLHNNLRNALREKKDLYIDEQKRLHPSAHLIHDPI